MCEVKTSVFNIMENFTTQHGILCCGKECISSVLHGQWMIHLFLVVTVLIPCEYHINGNREMDVEIQIYS